MGLNVLNTAPLPWLDLSRLDGRATDHLNFLADLREAAKRIRAPTLLLFGKYDPAISPAKDGRVAATTIAGSRSVTLPCGHASFAEVPELFLKEVLPFLVSAAPAGTRG